MACSRVNFTFAFYHFTPARLVREGEAVNWFQPVVLLYLDVCRRFTVIELFY